ncbi:unnamed protein product [Lupinus luteus]|uniref:CCT domain-containing protein n=1 Tax=Lupinus luteus TaxID=3873 RepID=A0AAV1XLN5_LUPLU
MYEHSNTAFSCASTPTTTLPSSASPPMIHDHLATLTEINTLLKVNNSEITSYNNNNSNNNSCSSGYSSCFYGNAASPSCVASTNLLMQNRSLSSNSLNQNHHNYYSGTHHTLSTFFAELLHSHDAPVRRVYSTGDLQSTNGMQQKHSSDSSLSSECSIIIEGMNRACRYSPDEKKARIERYRSKRNQRNFNKKIKYACRKTLADSRPRIRGRFARNEESDNNPPAQWNQIGCGDEYENWVTIYDSLVASNLAQESQDSSSFGLLY